MQSMLVTGASSGIGRAVALRAARAGFAVAGIGRNRAALDTLAAQIADEGGTAVVATSDVSRPENARAIVDLALHAFGRLDVLVNNAGTVAAGPLASQSDEAVRAQFGTHVAGPLALVRTALPALHAARGHVIMLGSGVARVPVGGLGAYPASKAALRSATATLRRELRALGIAVTYVDPGAVDTPFMKRHGMPGAPARLLTAPEDVARRIIVGLGTRPREINAAPLSTFAVAVAERFPRLTDLLLSRVDLVGSAGAGPDLAALAAAPPVAPAAAIDPPASTFTAALEPLQRRLERSSLGRATIAGWLVPGARLRATDVAARSFGMPNKHERALIDETLAALVTAGFLEAGESGKDFRVLRPAD